MSLFDRSLFFKFIFGYEFRKRANLDLNDFVKDFKKNHPTFSSSIDEFLKSLKIFDKKISTIARERSIDQMNLVDLSILRTALFEKQKTDNNKKIIINEAVNLAKIYGADNSYKFVNAVLDKLL